MHQDAIDILAQKINAEDARLRQVERYLKKNGINLDPAVSAASMMLVKSLQTSMEVLIALRDKQ